jgi:hypothetical protein
VEVIADPSANEVKITARVTAFGDTVDEAKSRLQNIKINVNRRDDQVLEVTAETPKAQNSAGTCSFAIRLPSVNGSTVRTGNGAVTLTGLGGPAELFTSVGSITVADHGDKVTAESGNGAIHITKVAGDVQVTSSVGQVRVQECGGSVKAKSGNGSLEITKAKGPVAARTSVGSVTVRDVSDSVMAETGNGAVTVVGVRGAVTAKASVGQVKLEQVSGDIKAETGNGSMTYTPAAGSAASFSLRSSVGSIAVHLPGSAAVGRVRAGAAAPPAGQARDRQPALRPVVHGRVSEDR